MIKEPQDPERKAIEKERSWVYHTNADPSEGNKSNPKKTPYKDHIEKGQRLVDLSADKVVQGTGERL